MNGRSEAEVVAATEAPVTAGDVTAALAAVGVAEGDTIVVHASLSALGWTVGGPQSVVEGVVVAVGPTGTVVMPAQTGVSDPSLWQAPPVPADWWPAIRDTWPVFDPAVTPLRGMGAVAECFRGLPDVVYSGHPSLGFMARGPLATDLMAGHDLAAGLGDDSPLGHLYRFGATIVMIGTGHGNNTALHLAEHRALADRLPLITDGAPLLVEGCREWVAYEQPDYDESDFVEVGRAFGEAAAAPLGRGTVTACDLVALVDFGTDWLARHRSADRG